MRKKENSDTIISAELIKETPLAWLLNCEGDEAWFPKSQCTYELKEQKLYVPQWLYNKKFPNG